jgi:hypothetical protein
MLTALAKCVDLLPATTRESVEVLGKVEMLLLNSLNGPVEQLSDNLKALSVANGNWESYKFHRPAVANRLYLRFSRTAGAIQLRSGNVEQAIAVRDCRLFFFPPFTHHN